MKQEKRLESSEMIARGMGALYKELGPVEARRFITAIHEMPREDSVKRHRRLQAEADPREFMKRVMSIQRSG